MRSARSTTRRRPERPQAPTRRLGLTLPADGTTAYISNEGGRPATASDFQVNSAGTEIVADPMVGAATTGTVSVADGQAWLQYRALLVAGKGGATPYFTGVTIQAIE